MPVAAFSRHVGATLVIGAALCCGPAAWAQQPSGAWTDPPARSGNNPPPKPGPPKVAQPQSDPPPSVATRAEAPPAAGKRAETRARKGKVAVARAEPRRAAPRPRMAVRESEPAPRLRRPRAAAYPRAYRDEAPMGDEIDLSDERLDRLRAAADAGYIVVRRRSVEFPDGRSLRIYHPYE